MANETRTEENSSPLTPFLIIGGILLATVVGIWWISQSGADTTSNNNGNTPTNGQKPKDNKVANYNNAPAGATPAHFKGSATSPVVVEEFADFQCPTCGVVHPKMNEISAKYGSRVKFIYRHFPLTSIHPNAYGAAVAAEAAGMQGKFWQMQDILFRNQSAWSNLPNPRDQFAEYAKKIGLDVDRFNNDILSMNTKQRVDLDMKRGRAMSLSSTPTVLINGVPVPFQQMEVADMSKLIDAELAKFDSSKDTQTKSEDDSSDKKDDSSDDKKEDDSKDNKKETSDESKKDDKETEKSNK